MRVATLRLGAVLVTAAVVASACSSSASTTKGDSTSPTGSGQPATSSVVAQAQAALVKDYAGTDRALPTTGPKAQKGKTVWVISCTQAGAGCALPAAAAMQAGAKIGWHMKLVDGKYDPAVFNQQVRAATAAKVDGIILVAVDCAAVQGSLLAAKKAGIKVYGLYSLDCDNSGGTPLFDASTNYGPEGNYGTYIENDYAHAAADYVIAKTGGKAKIIELRSDDLAIVKKISGGFESEIKKCAGCTVYSKTFTGADFLGGKLQSITSAMLTQHPDADVVFAPYDAAVLLGVGAAVQQAQAQGRTLMLTGGEGLPPNIKLITSGVETAAFGLPSGWSGWAAVDGLNRVFAGSPQVDAGIGHQTIDKDHNLPSTTTGYDGTKPSSTYQQNYLRIWGVS